MCNKTVNIFQFCLSKKGFIILKDDDCFALSLYYRVKTLKIGRPFSEDFSTPTTTHLLQHIFIYGYRNIRTLIIIKCISIILVPPSTELRQITIGRSTACASTFGTLNARYKRS